MPQGRQGGSSRFGSRIANSPVRGLLAALALLLSLAVLTPGVRAEGPSPAPRPLRYVTVNVFHGGVLSELTGRDQHLEARFELTVDALRALDPDVVALQEASAGRRRGDVTARLAARLGFHHVSVPPTIRFHSWPWLSAWVATFLDLTEGPAILSRFPIARWEVHHLPRCGHWTHVRVLLFAELETPWGRLPAFSVHTSGTACQAAHVADLVHFRRGRLPGVLMGDFNAAEDSAAIMAVTGTGLRDVFRLANPGEPGLTVWQPVTAPERRVRRRVDYLFLAPGSDFAGAVLGSRVVVDVPGRLPDGTPLWPSDHYGVLADLVVFPRGEAALIGLPPAARATIDAP